MARKAPSKSTKDLAYNPKNGWLRLGKGEEKELFAFCEDYRQFISAFKTERQVNDAGVAMAEKAGFISLEAAMAKGKALKAGTGIYHSVAGKTLLLMRIGKADLEKGLRIVGGHTDSPRLDLKPRPLYQDGHMAL